MTPPPAHDDIVSFLLSLLKERLAGGVGLQTCRWVGKHKVSQQLGEAPALTEESARQQSCTVQS